MGVPQRQGRRVRRLRPRQDADAARMGAPGVRALRGWIEGADPGSARRGEADVVRGREVRNRRHALPLAGRREGRRQRDQLRDAPRVRPVRVRWRCARRVEHPEIVFEQDEERRHRVVPRNAVQAGVHGDSVTQRPHGARQPRGVPGGHGQDGDARHVLRPRRRGHVQMEAQGPRGAGVLGLRRVMGGHAAQPGGHGVRDGRIRPSRPGRAGPRRRFGHRPGGQAVRGRGADDAGAAEGAEGDRREAREHGGVARQLVRQAMDRMVRQK